MKHKFSLSTLIASVLVSTLVASAISYKVTQNQLVQDSPFLVVDFTDLSKRLMLSMRDEITQSDFEGNPELIQLMAQSEARKLYNEISRFNPNKIVLSKTNIIYNPGNVDITNAVANKMGLDAVTDENIDEFINGTSKAKPKSDIVGVR